MAFNWTCPHCNIPQTVTHERFDVRYNHIGLESQKDGKLALEQTSYGCANPECEKTTLEVRVGPRKVVAGNLRVDREKLLFSQFLIPQGNAKPQPAYVPAPLTEDYYEACLIRDLSPKASATLIRRCLQGMIRDFAKIAKATLAAEIQALQKAVDDGSADRAISHESVAAIDHVRSIGNIGAHMEKQIDLIIEVDPGEAQALIELVEMLFEEWYGARHKRQAKFEHIAGIAGAKTDAKAGSAVAPANQGLAKPPTKAVGDDAALRMQAIRP